MAEEECLLLAEVEVDISLAARVIKLRLDVEGVENPKVLDEAPRSHKEVAEGVESQADCLRTVGHNMGHPTPVAGQGEFGCPNALPQQRSQQEHMMIAFPLLLNGQRNIAQIHGDSRCSDCHCRNDL